MSAGARLQLAEGAYALLVAIDGEQVVLVSPRAAPPGSTLQATLDDGSPVAVKVRGCRREGEAGFRIEGRFVNLSREQRRRLAHAP